MPRKHRYARPLPPEASGELRRLQDAQADIVNAYRRRDELMKELADKGVPRIEIAKAVGMTRGRVDQIIREPILYLDL